MKTPTSIDTPVANLLLYSEQFDNAAGWPGTTVTVTPNTDLAPNGVVSADTINDTITTEWQRVQQSIAIPADGSTWTVSIHVKKTSGTGNTFGINFNFSGGTLVASNLRLNTNTGAAVGTNVAVADAGAFWRLSGSLTNNGTNNLANVAVFPATGVNSNFGVDVVTATGSIVIWGAQLERGAVATAYSATTDKSGVQHNNLITWLQTATEIRMADLYTIALKAPVGSAVNLVPDPNGTALSWAVITGLQFVPTGGALSGGKWTYTGTGSPSSFLFQSSQLFNVTPGATYTLSGYIDATNVTSGTPQWAVFNSTFLTAYAQAFQFPGVSGRVATTFVIPAGVTQVLVICDSTNCIVTPGLQLAFSNPQVELGASASPYVPLNLLRYTTWDANLTVSGSTYLSGPPHFQRSHIEETLGLDVAMLDLEIAASSTDLVNGVPVLQLIASGVFDGAALRIDRLFMDAAGNQIGTLVRFSGIIGDADEVGRTSAKLSVHSLVQLLSMQLPRTVLQPSCTHTLFDAECTLVKSSFGRAGTVLGPLSQTKITTTLTDPDDYYSTGQVVFTSGPSSGLVKAVRGYTAHALFFNSPLPFMPNAGDAFIVYPGCDKLQTTCQNKFNNLANFGGYPFVPVPEAAL